METKVYIILKKLSLGIINHSVIYGPYFMGLLNGSHFMGVKRNCYN